MDASGSKVVCIICPLIKIGLRDLPKYGRTDLFFFRQTNTSYRFLISVQLLLSDKLASGKENKLGTSQSYISQVL